MHSRAASWLQPGRFNQCRLQCECTAARHLGFNLVVSISTGFNVNAQPRGIPASSWSLISAPVSTWGCIITPYKNPYPGMLLSLFFLPLQVKEGPGPSAHCSLRGKSRFTHGQGGGWAQEPPASERLPGARAELAAGQQQQAPTGGVAQGKWQRAHAAPQRR